MTRSTNGETSRKKYATVGGERLAVLAKARGRDRLVISGTEPDADVLAAV